ncbi:MAG: tyrosine-type recombinase/integrase [Symploca sp. SIO3C6]|nr:tyrosine-type recombinase/integrase [Symploca sp. SIO3C6]
MTNNFLVGIESPHGRLRIRVPRTLQLPNRYLSLNLPDTPHNRQLAETIAQRLSDDLADGSFDRSFKTYVSKFLPHKPVSPHLLMEIFDSYAASRTDLSSTTHAIDFAKIRRKLHRCPFQYLSQSAQIIDWAMMQLSADGAKRFLLQLRAACHWAQSSDFIDDNPFCDLPKFKKTLPTAPAPFTCCEQNLIIDAFENSHTYAYYTEFVKFLFFTGARPSEAIALNWEHISPDLKIITFSQAVVEGIRKDTKTHLPRRFPTNSTLQQLFERIRPIRYKPTQAVFPGPKGSLIQQHNFTTRAWRTTLRALPLRYRPPYSMRHTFITTCLEKGISVSQVAYWVGNSPKTIWQHYAGVICIQDVPTCD